MRTELEELILAGRIQVFKVDATIASQLAESFGNTIVERWMGKDSADRLHWDRSGLQRELAEAGDVGVAVYDVVADLITGLADIASFVIKAVSDAIGSTIDLVVDLHIKAAEFAQMAARGDFDGIKNDLKRGHKKRK